MNATIPCRKLLIGLPYQLHNVSSSSFSFPSSSSPSASSSSSSDSLTVHLCAFSTSLDATIWTQFKIKIFKFPNDLLIIRKILEWTENVCCCRCCFLLLLPNTLMQNLYGIQCQWHVLPLKLQLPLNSNSSSSSLHCLQRCSCRCRLSYFKRNRFNYVSCAASHGLVHRPIQTDCCHSNSCCVPASTVCALGLLECAHVHFMYQIVSVSVSILSLFPLPLSRFLSCKNAFTFRCFDFVAAFALQ